MERLFEIADNHGDRLSFGTCLNDPRYLHFAVTEVFEDQPDPVEEESQAVILDLDQEQCLAAGCTSIEIASVWHYTQDRARPISGGVQ